MKHIIKKYDKPFWFFGLSLVIPWVLWFVAAYLSHQPNNEYVLLQGFLSLLGLFAPMLVAVYFLLKDKMLLLDVFNRFWGKNLLRERYFWVAVVLPPVSIVMAQLLSVDLGHSFDQFHISGKPSFTSESFSPWLVLCLAPVVEELAWHSYGTDALRQRFSLLITSVLFAIYWGFWHFPLFFVKGYYHSTVQAEGWIYTLNFVVSLFVFVIVMNWLYYKSGRSIFITIVFHLVANVSNEIFATHPDSKVIQTGLFLILVAYLLIKERKLFFGKVEGNSGEWKVESFR